MWFALTAINPILTAWRNGWQWRQSIETRLFNGLGVYNVPKYLQVFFTKDEKKELARLAVELETSMAAIVRQAVQDYLIKHKPTETKTNES
jgi:hypothetical protein